MQRKSKRLLIKLKCLIERQRRIKNRSRENKENKKIRFKFKKWKKFVLLKFKE